MIHADRADDADVGVDDVGGIEPAAEPHLENRDVDAPRAEVIERRERVVFEERERDVAARGIDALERFDELASVASTPSTQMRSL